MNTEMLARNYSRKFRIGDKVFFAQNVKATGNAHEYYTGLDTVTGTGEVVQITPYSLVLKERKETGDLRKQISFTEIYCGDAIVCRETERKNYILSKTQRSGDVENVI